jgi:hypothetical protein
MSVMRLFNMCLRCSVCNFLIRLVGGGDQLGPVDTSATNWPILSALGDYEDREFGGMIIGRGPEVLGETLPQCHFVHHK